MALALTAFAVQRAAAGRGFETTTGKPAPLAQAELGPWRLPALLLFALVALAAVAAPLASMLAAALANLSGGLSLANLTLANFRRAVPGARRGLGRAVHQPVAGGRRAALLAGAVGLLAAWCVAGRHVPAPRH